MPPALLAVCRSLLAPFTISSERNDVALSPERADISSECRSCLPVLNVPPYRIEDASTERRNLLGTHHLLLVASDAHICLDDSLLAGDPPLHLAPHDLVLRTPPNQVQHFPQERRTRISRLAPHPSL